LWPFSFGRAVAGSRVGVAGPTVDDDVGSRAGRCLDGGLGRCLRRAAAAVARHPAANGATKRGAELARHEVVENRIRRRAEVVENACSARVATRS